MPLYVRTLLVTGPPEDVQAAAQSHREHVRELYDRGKLRAAGEFPNGDGFLEIFEARDLHEAQSVTGASPLVFEGLGTYLLREWSEMRFD